MGFAVTHKSMVVYSGIRPTMFWTYRAYLAYMTNNNTMIVRLQSGDIVAINEENSIWHYGMQWGTWPPGWGWWLDIAWYVSTWLAMWHLWSMKCFCAKISAPSKLFNSEVVDTAHRMCMLRNVKLGLSTRCWLISELPNRSKKSESASKKCAVDLKASILDGSHLFEPGYPKRYPKR